MRPTLKHLLAKRKVLITIVIIVGSMSLGVATFAVRSKKTAHDAPQPPDVEVVPVEQRNVSVYGEWIGTTDGMVNAEIKAQVTGYLLKQDYKEGSFVKKGQLLFEIDPRPFQAALDQAQGQLAQFQGQLQQASSHVEEAQAQVAEANSQLLQMQAQLAQAQANQVKAQLDVNKYEPLVQQKAVTQQDYDNAAQANVVAKAQVKAAEAAIESARAQVRAANAQVGTAKAAVAAAQGQIENANAAIRSAELNLGFTRIISPIDGIAGLAQAQVGNLISTASPALTTVSTVDPIKVYFTVSEQEYLNYNRRNPTQEERDAASKNLQLELFLSDGTAYPETGSFYFADRQVDQKTGAIRLAGIFPNPGNVLRPGQYGRVRAVTTTKNDALLVPQRAVTQLQGGYQVAVVGADNHVEIRSVKVGDRDGALWIIEEGLKAGESVVVEGLQRIKPGAAVNPKPYSATK